MELWNVLWRKQSHNIWPIEMTILWTDTHTYICTYIFILDKLAFIHLSMLSTCPFAGERPIWQWGAAFGAPAASRIFASGCASLNATPTTIHIYTVQEARWTISGGESLPRWTFAGFRCAKHVSLPLGGLWISRVHFWFPFVVVLISNGHGAVTRTHRSTIGGRTHQEFRFGLQF